MNELNKLFNVGSDGLPDSDTIPLYRQIINNISQAISSGRLKDGERLPTEPELMKLFKVSRVTLRSAMQNLEDNGFLIRIQGKGTFVNSPPYHLAYNKYFGFADACKKKGKKSSSTILSRDRTIPSKQISEFLQVDANTPIPTISILRYVNDDPAVIETSYWHDSTDRLIKSDPANLDDSVYAYLRKFSIVKSLGGKFSFSTALPTENEIKLLKLENPHTPLLVTSDWHYSLPDNKPFFVTIQKTNTEIVNYYWDRVIDLHDN